jgi:hypothetical protein
MMAATRGPEKDSKKKPQSFGSEEANDFSRITAQDIWNLAKKRF